MKPEQTQNWNASDELEGLVNDWCNRQCGADQVQRLEELLLDDYEARHYYRRMMNIHAELHEQSESAVENQKVITLPTKGKNRNRIFAWGGWAVAASVAISALMLQLASRKAEKPIAAAESQSIEVPSPTVGLMVNHSGAQFAGLEDDMPIRFGPGKYQLESGIVHLRMTNGVDVVMRGPATFGLHDPKLMTLENGALRAIVPNSGKGFTVQSPEMAYEDLGTEFGVFVQDGRSEMHVFNGQVDAHQISTNSKVASVYDGESLRQEGPNFTVDVSEPEMEFPLPEDVGFGGWLSQQPSTIIPDGLIAYYPFNYDPELPEVLKNEASNVPSHRMMADGLVMGARWVSGRWSEKDALLFNQQGEHAEFEIPGEYEEITLSVWANIDHLDNSLNAIMTSTGWSPGDLHWQILRSQDPILAIHEIAETGSLLVKPIELGRWIHLVAVVSKTERRTRFYVDGHLAQENKLPADALVKPGKVWMGDWKQEADDRYVKRNFRGKIDELAIWDRALTGDEIKELTHAGTPSMLLMGRTPEVIATPRRNATFPAPDVRIEK
ncbi:LamG-like jellyroll fold domain-containing protein [Roseibacillus persicicus]|uniref:LamG-like jellyroll fold domain-containing protein n=1 Tax=Roseibacillus persicicus TaxID=454148 RepID=A0A918TJ39_9BACT|nr:LamG-like jellyroll fold domain-containing protein [Roseibacillus persicicus]GHC48058.1 hypothetical protein GCM10007100_12370 [Roseibacillus persicicus]